MKSCIMVDGCPKDNFSNAHFLSDHNFALAIPAKSLVGLKKRQGWRQEYSEGGLTLPKRG